MVNLLAPFSSSRRQTHDVGCAPERARLLQGRHRFPERRGRSVACPRNARRCGISFHIWVCTLICRRSIFGLPGVRLEVVPRSSSEVVSRPFAEILRTLGDRPEPLVMTKNDEAKTAIQDTESLERIQDTIASVKILALGNLQIEAGFRCSRPPMSWCDFGRG